MAAGQGAGPGSQPGPGPGSQPGSGQTVDASPGPIDAPLAVGCRVQLLQRPSYLKTADPMPMLRPPDLVDLSELGEVVALRPLNTVAVRFRRGTFLIDGALLRRQDGSPAR